MNQKAVQVKKLYVQSERINKIKIALFMFFVNSFAAIYKYFVRYYKYIKYHL